MKKNICIRCIESALFSFFCSPKSEKSVSVVHCYKQSFSNKFRGVHIALFSGGLDSSPLVEGKSDRLTYASTRSTDIVATVFAARAPWFSSHYVPVTIIEGQRTSPGWMSNVLIFGSKVTGFNSNFGGGGGLKITISFSDK